MLPKSCHQKTVTNLNTLRHVTLVEVRQSPYQASHRWLTLPRIHLWLLGVCGNCCRHSRESCTCDRRTVLQSGGETTRQQLAATQARTGRCPYLAGMVNMLGLGAVSTVLTAPRTAEQSEGGKTVGVDPTVITARGCALPTRMRITSY